MIIYACAHVCLQREREREAECWVLSAGNLEGKRGTRKIAKKTFNIFKQCGLIPPEIRHNHVFSLRRLSNSDALILQKPVLVRLTSHYIVAGCLDNLLHFDIPWLETGESCLRWRTWAMWSCGWPQLHASSEASWHFMRLPNGAKRHKVVVGILSCWGYSQLMSKTLAGFIRWRPFQHHFHPQERLQFVVEDSICCVTSPLYSRKRSTSRHLSKMDGACATTSFAGCPERSEFSNRWGIVFQSQPTWQTTLKEVHHFRRGKVFGLAAQQRLIVACSSSACVSWCFTFASFLISCNRS